jgi:hypothetical protein
MSVRKAGNQSEWVTGQCLEVSGGYGIGAPIFGDMAEPAPPRSSERAK